VFAVAVEKLMKLLARSVLVDKPLSLLPLVRGITHSLGVVTNDSLGNKGSKVVSRVPAHTLDSEAILAVPMASSRTRTSKPTSGRLLGKQVSMVLGTLARETGEVLLRQLDELLVGNATSTNQDHAVGRVVVLDVVDELVRVMSRMFWRGQGWCGPGLGAGKQWRAGGQDDLLNLLLDLLGLP